MTATEPKAIAELPPIAIPKYKPTRAMRTGVGIELNDRTYGAFLYDVALADQDFRPGDDGYAEWQRIKCAVNATVDAGEAEQAARAAESRAAATQAAIDQATEGLKDALVTIDKALRAGEPVEDAERHRGQLEAARREQSRRLPILTDEAKRLRVLADAERRRLFRDVVGDIHRQAEREYAALRRTATEALLPLFAKFSFLQSLESVAFRAT